MENAILYDMLTLVLAVGLPLLEIMAIASAIHAVMTGRTSQGAIAWGLSLITFPFLVLPLYWIFGRKKFSGYVEALRKGREEYSVQANEILQQLRYELNSDKSAAADDLLVFENLARFPFCACNALELLVDGRATFKRMFEVIGNAREYLLIQFFIVHDDLLGRELQSLLIKKAKEGVRIYFLFDEIGCHKLPRAYIQELEAAGVHTSAFKTTRGRGNRFQLNFRNHRKITVIDGRIAFLGGHNVGDKYMGRNARLGRWRDTHLSIHGPSAHHVQMAFVLDWFWATRETLTLTWEYTDPPKQGADLLILPTGPADALETCSLMFVNAINMSRKRIWIASPYFIPNEALIKALQIAALRGVDVRIMLPEKPDHRIVYLAGFSYLVQLDIPGITFWRYQPGFLHQKVFLVDNTLACVGTANADNRSFRLNFEISALISDPAFIQQVEQMLQTDFSECRQAGADDYRRQNMFFKLGVKLATLLSPIL